MGRLCNWLRRLFGKPRCFPSPGLFILAGWSAKPEGASGGLDYGRISDLARDHFTIAGPYNPPISDPNWLDGWMDAELEDCITSNLCLAYTIAPRRTVADPGSKKYHGPVGTPIRVGKGDVNRHDDQEVKDASDDQLRIWIADVEQQIRSAVADPKRSRHIALWKFWPDELRLNYDKERDLLAGMYDAVQRCDPLQRPTMMYEPQHSDAARLEAAIPYLDLVTVGVYLHLLGHDHKRIRVRYTMEQTMRAIERTGSDALPIPALEMLETGACEYAEAEIPLIPTFVKHDAYCAFANGAQGLFVFSMGQRPGFRRDTYIAYYTAWANVSRELLHLGLRDVIRFGRVIDLATFTVTSGPENVVFQWDWKPEQAGYEVDETYSSISLREWFYKWKRYILIVNSAESPVELVLDGLRTGTCRELFTNTRYSVRAGSILLSLPPLGVMLLTQFLPWIDAGRNRQVSTHLDRF